MPAGDAQRVWFPEMFAELETSWSRTMPWEEFTDFGEVRHHLTRQGTPIGPNDLLIAAHALAADLTLVTANTREFERVPSLRVENWLLELTDSVPRSPRQT